MPYSPAASVAGVALRITRLDAAGNLLNGTTDSYITTAFIRVSFTPEYEEGDEITEKAADGTVCVSFKAPDTLKRVNMEVAICDPDPELSALLSGGLLLSSPKDAANPTGGEISVGWASAQVGEDPSGNGVAIEVWSKAIDNGKQAGFFHWVFPYVKTRLSGDRVIENGLLATTFEGFGLGNIMFRNGPDGSWLWPAAADRPYLYARSDRAPIGLRGFFQYDVQKAAAGGVFTPATPLPTPPSFANIVGVNVPGGKDPYPYDSGQAFDPALSSVDYVADDSGTASWEGSADSQTVKNTPPAAPAVQNPVTYLDRGAPSSGSPMLPGQKPKVQGVTRGIPGVFTPLGAEVPTNLAALQALNISGGSPWEGREYVALGTGQAHWTGSAWAAGAAPVRPGQSLPANPAITASDAPNAAKLAAEGYTASPTTAWAPGERFTIGGTFEFSWSGSAWAAGPRP